MKNYAAAVVPLALLWISRASQHPPPPPPPLKLVAESASEPRVTPPPPTGAQLLAQQPAEVQTAIKEHEQHGKWLRHRTAEAPLYPNNQEPAPTLDCAPVPPNDGHLQPGRTIPAVPGRATEP